MPKTKSENGVAKKPRGTPKGVLPKAGRGRPIYEPKFDKMAFKLALLGAKDTDIAAAFGVSDIAIMQWREKYPTFALSIYEGREGADAEVAHSMYHRAKGFSQIEKEARTVSLGGNAGSQVEIVEIEKHYPPDTTAAMFWLRARHKKVWGERTEINASPDLTEKLSQLIDKLPG